MTTIVFVTVICPAGTESGDCKQCQKGYFKSSPGIEGCDKCPENYTSTDDRKQCICKYSHSIITSFSNNVKLLWWRFNDDQYRKNSTHCWTQSVHLHMYIKDKANYICRTNKTDNSNSQVTKKYLFYCILKKYFVLNICLPKPMEIIVQSMLHPKE